MKQKPQNRWLCYQLIRITFYILGPALSIPYAQAEVTLDGSLGSNRPLTGPDYQIPADVGRQAGTNLFHSFERFNLNASESATFTAQGATGTIENILARVTSGQSMIDGLLRSEIPDANLYLINPAGIVFGEHARLDIQGSFHATTADYIGLKDGQHFQALPSPQDTLLNVAPPESFGFLTDSPLSISVMSGNVSHFEDNNSQGLSVLQDRTLSLVGGDLILQNGVLTAPGGKVNLISSNAIGEIKLSHSQSLTDPLSVRGDILISDNSRIDVSDNQAGSITVEGHKVELSSSDIIAKTESEKGGEINVKADFLHLSATSTIKSSTNGKGTAGMITVTAPRIEIIDLGSQIASMTVSSGNAGNIEIKAMDITIDARGLGQPTKIVTITGISSIATSELIDTEIGVEIGSDIRLQDIIPIITQATGDAGKVTVTGINGQKSDEITIDNRPSIDRDSISLAGIGSTTIFSQGHASTTTVASKKIKLYGGGTISSSSVSALGNASTVTIQADEILISGYSSLAIPSAIDSSAIPSAIDSSAITLPGARISTGNAGKVNVTAREAGHAGIVNVTAREVFMQNGGTIGSSTFSSGRAGEIFLKTDLLNISGANNSSIATGLNAFAQFGSTGSSGNIDVQANRIFIDGNNSNGLTGIGNITRSTTPNTTEQSGEIKVTADQSIELRNGGGISSSTFSEDNAGSITVNTGHLLIDGTGSFPEGIAGSWPSGIGSRAELNSTGNAGKTHVTADTIELTNGGAISSSSLGEGNAGLVTVATKDLRIDGAANPERPSRIGSSTEAESMGHAGETHVTADTIEISNGGTITSRSLGSNTGESIGEIKIQVSDVLRLQNESSITVETNTSDAGDIVIDTPAKNSNQGALIFISDESKITTSVASGSGQGGNIKIGHSERKHAIAALVLDSSSKIEADAKAGAGGSIDIHAQSFIGSENNITASSETKGLEGTVRLNSPDTDLVNKLLILPSNFIDATSILGKPCAQRSDSDVIRFMVRQYEALPQSPQALWDYLPETIMDTTSEAPSTNHDIHAFQWISDECHFNTHSPTSDDKPVF